MEKELKENEAVKDTPPVVEQSVEPTIKDVKVEKPIKKPQKELAPAIDDKWSDDIGELMGALAKAQGEMHNGVKGKSGHHGKYMELGSLLDIARPALAKYGICVIQSHSLRRGIRSSLVTKTLISHESGQWFQTSLDIPIEANKALSHAQIIGVACTYARRYAYQALCGIASEADTDGKA